MHMNRRELFSVAASAGLAIISPPARAQSYPSRPIRLIVPSSPGGVHDIVARLWAEKLKPFGNIVVENRSGAGTEEPYQDVSTHVGKHLKTGHTHRPRGSLEALLPLPRSRKRTGLSASNAMT